MVIQFYIRNSPLDGRDNLAQSVWYEYAGSESPVYGSAPQHLISPLVNWGRTQKLCLMGTPSIPLPCSLPQPVWNWEKDRKPTTEHNQKRVILNVQENLRI